VKVGVDLPRSFLPEVADGGGEMSGIAEIFQEAVISASEAPRLNNTTRGHRPSFVWPDFGSRPCGRGDPACRGILIDGDDFLIVRISLISGTCSSNRFRP